VVQQRHARCGQTAPRDAVTTTLQQRPRNIVKRQEVLETTKSPALLTLGLLNTTASAALTTLHDIIWFPWLHDLPLLHNYGFNRHTVERRGRVAVTPASYSRGPGFKYRPRRPAILVEVFRGSPQSLQANAGIIIIIIIIESIVPSGT
jgi:hypothetical protein